MDIYNLGSKLRRQRGTGLELEVVGKGHMVLFPREVYSTGGSGYFFFSFCWDSIVYMYMYAYALVCVLFISAQETTKTPEMRLSLSLLLLKFLYILSSGLSAFSFSCLPLALPFVCSTP